MTSNNQFISPPMSVNLPNLSVPPPIAPNLSAPPPPIVNPTSNYQHRFTNYRETNRGFFKPFRPYHAPKIISGGQEVLPDEFDGKRLRKSVMRKTVDYNSAIIKTLENRIWQRDYRDRRALQPDVIYYPDLLPPPSYIDNPINAVTTRFVKTATNKMRCPIFCMAWTPEGRRLVTGASSGEFTLWNGLTFNFETILQAHDSPVRTMVWSHNESWMVTGDHAGYVKYWQSNMNNVKMFQAHKEAIRGLSFSPTDHKLATCSDDGTVRIWDFLRCHEERILRGHGADVKCVHWHPQKSLVISGSKDNQQPVKLWDPKSGASLATLHAHKSTVMDVKWNENGNWLVTASRDHLLKLFDLRNLNQEVQTFRGHKKEASSIAWHPSHEGLFCSGGSDGAILFWHVGADKEVGAIEQAHDSIVWTLAWHPLGHILCSGSNDHTSKFWTRNRPGDLMRDKYNLNTLPAGAGGIDDHEIADEGAVIPGMGPEDRIITEVEEEEKNGEIPGLDLSLSIDESKKSASKKVPYSKPIPRNFQAQWNEMEGEDIEQVEALNAIVNQLIETTPGAVPLNDVTPSAIILYGKMIPVKPESKLAEAISKGSDAIQKLVQSGEIEELREVEGLFDNQKKEEEAEEEDYLQDDSEIDFTKIPDVELPAPLASSKFAQNPELLKALNTGGKCKFDQLIGWNDGSSATSQQPIVNESIADDSQSSDTDLRFKIGLFDGLSSKNNFNDIYKDNFRKNTYVDKEQDFKSEISNDPQRSDISNEDSNDNRRFENNSLQNLGSYSDSRSYNERDSDNRLQTFEENSNSKKLNLSSTQSNLDRFDNVGTNLYNDHSSSHKPNQPPTININPSIPPPFYSLRMNSPSSSMSNNFNSSNFRPPPNNIPPHLSFRPTGSFSPFNNFPGPPPNFRPSNFDRGSFPGPGFRGFNSPQRGGGPTNNYNSNFGNFPGKNGHGRGSPMNRMQNDSNINHSNRGRGKDNDHNRGRGRDQY